MRFYKVIGYKGAKTVLYYEPTQHAAHWRQYEMEKEHKDWDKIEVEILNIDTTRHGIIQLLRMMETEDVQIARWEQRGYKLVEKDREDYEKEYEAMGMKYEGPSK